MRLKIRGIYSTALTRLVLDAGQSLMLVAPSERIRERFHVDSDDEFYDLLIRDCEDLHGVELLGSSIEIWQTVRFLQERLIDAVMMEFESSQDEGEPARARVEFPGASKELLDEIRASVVPTISGHHRLRIVASQAVKEAELKLAARPDRKRELEQEAFNRNILEPLRKSGQFRVEHIHIAGKPIRPREGIIVEADSRRVLIKRTFRGGGRYDGLDLPIEGGDYCLSELVEGCWHLSHTYYSQDGEPKGTYYNVNTPVEFYPFGARYLDLEVDVIQRPGEPPFMVDVEKLAFAAREGSIGERLENQAFEVARDLRRRLHG